MQGQFQSHQRAYGLGVQTSVGVGSLYSRPCFEQGPDGLPARSGHEMAQERRLVDRILAKLTDPNLSAHEPPRPHSALFFAAEAHSRRSFTFGLCESVAPHRHRKVGPSRRRKVCGRSLVIHVKPRSQTFASTPILTDPKALLTTAQVLVSHGAVRPRLAQGRAFRARVCQPWPLGHNWDVGGTDCHGASSLSTTVGERTVRDADPRRWSCRPSCRVDATLRSCRASRPTARVVARRGSPR
jgi:hypothetical protein